MNVRKGSTVWVSDKELAWIPAEVIDSDDKFVQIVTGTGKKVSFCLFMCTVRLL
jgi:myosin-5